MKVKEFIKVSIHDIVRSFDNVSCAYQFDSVCDTHYIKILPTEIFEDSDDLAILQADIIDAFNNSYPNQSIIFITDGSLISIGEPEYIVSGSSYEDLCSNLEWNFDDVNELLMDFAPQIKTSFVVEQEIHEMKQCPMICEFSFEDTGDGESPQPLSIDENPSDYPGFSLAA